MADISVIGLGMMGSRIAETLIDRGRSVVVWNRTAARAAKVVERGAALMDTAQQAVAASPVTIICLDTATSVQLVLDSIDDPSAGRGRTIVNLTSSNREEAIATDAKVARLSGEYLDGHINVIVDDIGKSDAIIMYAGSVALWERHEKVLRDLGGGAMHVGEDIGAACVMAAGVSGFFHSSLLGFYEALAFARTVGLPLDQFAVVADDRIRTLREYVLSAFEVIGSESLDVRQSSVTVHRDGLSALSQMMVGAGSATALAMQAESYLEQAVAAGNGALDIAATIEVMLPDSAPARADTVQ